LGVTPPMNCPLSVVANFTAVSLRSGWPWASVTVAVALVVDWASARMVDGFSTSVMAAADPAIWVRVAWPVPAPTVAVMVVGPIVVELVNETLHTPLELVTHDGGVGVEVTASPVEVKETDSSGNAFCPSVTVACADVADLPSARMLGGVSTTVTTGAVCVSVCDWLIADVVSVARTFVGTAVVELWIWTVQIPVVPVGSVVHDD
jgi:hypothetical protein